MRAESVEPRREGGGEVFCHPSGSGAAMGRRKAARGKERGAAGQARVVRESKDSTKVRGEH